MGGGGGKKIGDTLGWSRENKANRAWKKANPGVEGISSSGTSPLGGSKRATIMGGKR